jgi:predicted Zn-ribbon and HTH transcriptional regulator
MTDNALKSVLVLDPETQGYKPVAHNLGASEAVTLAEQFSNENQTAKVLDQKDRHLVSDPAKCRSCKKAAATAQNRDDQPQPAEPVAS